MDGIGDVAKEVGANVGVPHIAASDFPGCQPKVQHDEVLVWHDDTALAKRSKRVVMVLLDGCNPTNACISMMTLLSGAITH